MCKYIVFYENEYHLCGKIAVPKIYCENLHAYEVNHIEDWFIVKPTDILNAHKHRYFSHNNKNYAFSIFDITYHNK